MAMAMISSELLWARDDGLSQGFAFKAPKLAGWANPLGDRDVEPKSAMLFIGWARQERTLSTRLNMCNLYRQGVRASHASALDRELLPY
jgi:hypothetical protein